MPYLITTSANAEHQARFRTKMLLIWKPISCKLIKSGILFRPTSPRLIQQPGVLSSSQLGQPREMWQAVFLPMLLQVSKPLEKTERRSIMIYRVVASEDLQRGFILQKEKYRTSTKMIQVSHPSFPTTDLTDLLRALVGLRPLGIPKGDACHWKDARNLTDSSCANNLITLFPVDNHYVYI